MYKRKSPLIEKLEQRVLLHGTGSAFSINSGGGTFVDSFGTTWTADAYFTGGTASDSSFPVAKTTDDGIYTSRRFGTNFSYSLPVANGNYELELRFCDPYWTAIGQRKFDVKAEGVTILNDFDIIADGGAKAAVDKTFEVTISDGKLDLQFTKVIDAAIISGIELTADVPETVPAAPTNLVATVASDTKINLSWKDNSDNESEFAIQRSTDGVNFSDVAGVTTNKTSATDTGLTAGTTYYYRVFAANSAGESMASNIASAKTLAAADPAILRVNAAGGSIVDNSDHIWSADTGFTGGTTSVTPFEVQNSDDDYIYYTRRIGTNFNYSLPVANGNYELKLFFAEPFWTAAGQRKFNVKAEGKSVLTNYDIVADVGTKTATIKSFNVSITDGKLDLDFSRVTDNAIISGIALLPGAPTQSNTIKWTPTAPALSIRSETQGATLNGKVYVFGGLNSQLVGQKNVDVYDVATNKWTALRNMPEPMSHAGVAIIGTTVWLAGGWMGIPGDPNYGTTHVWKYDTLTDTWTRGPDLPTPRGAGQLALLNGELHFFGGWSNDRTFDVGDHLVLNPNGGTTWSTRAPLPIPTNHLGVAVLGGKIYAIGGSFGHNEAAINTSLMHRYDPATDTWTRLADMPIPRSHVMSAVMVINGRIIVAGGDSQTQISVNNVTAYDPTTNTWTAMTPLPMRRMAGVIQYVNGRIFMATGNGAGVESNLTWIGDLVP